MKIQTHLILIDELHRHDYGNSGEYDIQKLFKLYTTCEITAFEDIRKEHKAFLHFVYENIDKFKGLTREADGSISKEEEKSLVSMARYLTIRLEALHSKFYINQRYDQENFAETVAKIIGNNKVNLLEVGSGEVPYSSILLAHDLGKITSMDHFLLSDESLKSLNVNPINDYFNKDTDISDFGFIVGQRPCSVIAEIVKQCTKDKKPYFLQLCECNSPTHDIDGWQKYLKLFDPKIKFSKRSYYAYNLDSPELK